MSFFELDYWIFNLTHDAGFIILGILLLVLLPRIRDLFVSNSVEKGHGFRLANIPRGIDVLSSGRTYLKTGSNLSLLMFSSLVILPLCNLGVDITAPPKCDVLAGSSYTGATYGNLDTSADAAKAAVPVYGQRSTVCEHCCSGYVLFPPSSVNGLLLSDAWQGSLPGVRFSKRSEEVALALNYVGGFEPRSGDSPSSFYFVPNGLLVEMTNGMPCTPVSGQLQAIGGDRTYGLTPPQESGSTVISEFCYPQDTKQVYQPKGDNVGLKFAIDGKFPVLDNMDGYRNGVYGTRIQATKLKNSNDGPLHADWMLTLRTDGKAILLKRATTVQVGKLSSNIRAQEEIAFMQSKLGGQWDLFRVTAAHERGCFYLLASMNAPSDLLTSVETWEQKSGGCVLYTNVVCRLDEDEEDRIQVDRPCTGVGSVSGLLPVSLGKIDAVAEAIALLLANVDPSESDLPIRTFQSVFATTAVATAKSKEYSEVKERIIPDITFWYYICVGVPLLVCCVLVCMVVCCGKARFKVPNDGYNWLLMGQRDKVFGMTYIESIGKSTDVHEKVPTFLFLGLLNNANPDSVEERHYGLTPNPKPWKEERNEYEEDFAAIALTNQ